LGAAGQTQHAPVQTSSSAHALTAAFQYLKGPTGRMERDFSKGGAVIGQGGMALN